MTWRPLFSRTGHGWPHDAAGSALAPPSDGSDAVVQLLTFVAGAAVIVAIVWTVFQDLFHPSGSSALSDWIGRAMFKALRRRRRLLPFAGPLGVLTVIATWVMSLVFRFALLYYGTYAT